MVEQVQGIASEASVRRPKWRVSLCVVVVLCLSLLAVGWWVTRAEVAGSGSTAGGAQSVADAPRGALTSRLSSSSSAPETSQRDDEPGELPSSGRGTELFDSLPQQVGPFSLVQITERELDGALEFYSAVYVPVAEDGEAVGGSGAVDLTVSRWATETEAKGQMERGREVFAGQDHTLIEVEVPERLAQGATFAVAADGTMTLFWSSFTTAGSITGDAADVRVLFDEFRLGPAGVLAGE